jgi:replicative DNA helicase
MNGRARPSSGKRVLPQNLDAEQSVLGGILLRNDLLASLDALEVNDFADLRNQVVFGAMRVLQVRQEPIDIVTLEVEIEKLGKLDALGGVAYLGELAGRVPTADNVATYARIVREKALLRQTATALADQLERVYDWEYEADEFLGEAMADLERLNRRHRETTDAIPTITVRAALDELIQLARTPVYKTPFEGLNTALGFGGLLSGQVYYLAGGTGFGKTSWIASVVNAHALAGGRALVAFYEMFAGYYVARMAAKGLGVHSNQILRGEVDFNNVASAIPEGIEFLDNPSLIVLRRAIDRVVRAGHAPPLVVVDYIQLVGDMVSATMQRPDPRLANALASAGLRAIAKETGAALLVVSAASRATGKKLVGEVRKQPPRDLIDAARESGAIEYDGAGVIVLSVSDELDADDLMIATITVAKARFGEAQHLDARYDGKTGWWKELGRVVTPRKVPETMSSVRGAIFAALSDGPIKTKNMIAKKTGGTKQVVLAEIDAMVADGVLRMGADGYSRREIAPAPATPEPTRQTDFGGL